MRDFVAGVRYFVRGMAWVARRPRQWLFGLVPALIVLVVYVAALLLLGTYDWDLAGALSPFARHWSPAARDALRGLIAVLVFGAAVMVAVVTFTGVTLAVGDPFYESLSGRVEDAAGGRPPQVRVPLVRQVGRAVADAVIVGSVTGLFALLFFVLGFLPLVGQTVVPVVAALVSGNFLAFELTSIPLGRRGLRRRERFALLRRGRAAALGFGASVFVAFLVPFGAVLTMPGAVAGGTLLARERLAGHAITPDQEAVHHDTA